MRRRGPSKPSWPSWAGVALLVGLILLQLLSGILTNLAAELLPKEWAQRRWALVVFMLVIATALAALLTEVLDRSRSVPIGAHPDGERDVDVNDDRDAAPSHAPASRLATTQKRKATRSRSGMLLDVLRPVAVAMIEALAMLGFLVRMAF